MQKSLYAQEFYVHRVADRKHIRLYLIIQRALLQKHLTRAIATGHAPRFSILGTGRATGHRGDHVMSRNVLTDAFQQVFHHSKLMGCLRRSKLCPTDTTHTLPYRWCSSFEKKVTPLKRCTGDTGNRTQHPVYIILPDILLDSFKMKSRTIGLGKKGVPILQGSPRKPREGSGRIVATTKCGWTNSR
ncbi:unnamed protein product [Trypanosoma congolense IL3000]|uniref:WGS project CAEQ00000000 data, annotated contig 2451 n=1 Tax=Trypanosoma congolense (strain IL3000) TaxID=1068625 RepID=F9WEA6_TRYCI|nr:unnamed protein product [Trypanosoma congolense IL3000]